MTGENRMGKLFVFSNKNNNNNNNNNDNNGY